MADIKIGNRTYSGVKYIKFDTVDGDANLFKNTNNIGSATVTAKSVTVTNADVTVEDDTTIKLEAMK